MIPLQFTHLLHCEVQAAVTLQIHKGEAFSPDSMRVSIVIGEFMGKDWGEG
jgi:hypothetical protein